MSEREGKYYMISNVQSKMCIKTDSTVAFASSWGGEWEKWEDVG
jgi:hypothetical protein